MNYPGLLSQYVAQSLETVFQLAGDPRYVFGGADGLHLHGVLVQGIHQHLLAPDSQRLQSLVHRIQVQIVALQIPAYAHQLPHEFVGTVKRVGRFGHYALGPLCQHLSCYAGRLLQPYVHHLNLRRRCLLPAPSEHHDCTAPPCTKKSVPTCGNRRACPTFGTKIRIKLGVCTVLYHIFGRSHFYQIKPQPHHGVCY